MTTRHSISIPPGTPPAVVQKMIEDWLKWRNTPPDAVPKLYKHPKESGEDASSGDTVR